jgi:predicted Zn-dependent protease
MNWSRLGAALILTGLVLGTGVPVRGQSSSSQRAEFKVADERLKKILATFPPAADPVDQARVDRIGQKVAAVTPLANIPWTFVLVDMPMPNAACVGEGHVFVTRALLDMGITDDELAGVLGHEIAHGVRRHPFRRVELLANIKQLFADYNRLQRQVDAQSLTSNYDVNLLNQVESYERRRDDLQYRFDHEVQYSQLDEEEADVLGMRYAVAAGFSADGLGHCLEKLEKAAVEQFGTAVLSDDMSHPPTRRRLEILRMARRNYHL